jgi:hypothetical protein
LEVRSDISDLASSHPDLANEFRSLRNQLDSPTEQLEGTELGAIANSKGDVILESFEKECPKLVKRFDEVLQEIRSLDGFGNFLQGPSKPEILSLASEGSIVLFNVSVIGSDAIIITHFGIRSIQLLSLTEEALEEHAKCLSLIDVQNLSKYSKSSTYVNEILEWLWDVAVNPILIELGFTQTPEEGESWPRI